MAYTGEDALVEATLAGSLVRDFGQVAIKYHSAFTRGAGHEWSGSLTPQFSGVYTVSVFSSDTSGGKGLVGGASLSLTVVAAPTDAAHCTVDRSGSISASAGATTQLIITARDSSSLGLHTKPHPFK